MGHKDNVARHSDTFDLRPYLGNFKDLIINEIETNCIHNVQKFCPNTEICSLKMHAKINPCYSQYNTFIA